VVKLVLDQRAEAGVVEARGDHVDGDEEVRHLPEPVCHQLRGAALLPLPHRHWRHELGEAEDPAPIAVVLLRRPGEADVAAVEVLVFVIVERTAFGEEDGARPVAKRR
jgi:hypothetical protein